jgi:hypothetical protein
VFAANQDFPAHQCNRATKLRTCDGTMSDLFLNASRTVGVMFAAVCHPTASATWFILWVVRSRSRWAVSGRKHVSHDVESCRSGDGIVWRRFLDIPARFAGNSTDNSRFRSDPTQ